MKKFKYTCYPSVDSFYGEVEAETKEEAIKLAQEQSNANYGFWVSDGDVEEIED